MKPPHFKQYSKGDLLSLTRVRRFETKLGEQAPVLPAAESLEAALKQLPAQYVIFGVPEDIGVMANGGQSGASTAWIPFLQSLLNIQSNDFLSGDDVAVIGHFDFGDLQFLIEKNASTTEEKEAAYRHAVQTIDEGVEKLVKAIVAEEKTPIVIGGGHNNAYPLIKGAAKGLLQSGQLAMAQINCINLDAHADYRPLEGRHSGNPFRYAEEDGFLEKYCVLCIHENYIPQNVWMDVVNNPFMDLITYEDVFVHEKQNFRQAVAHAIGYTEDNFTGIELDLDSVQNVLSSAATPTGISVLQARQYLNWCAANCKVAYLHICEGAVRLPDGRTAPETGKLLSYLVSDFIKMHAD